MLLMVKKGIRGGICYAIHRYAKANNKHMKNYDKDIELNAIPLSTIPLNHHILNIYMQTNVLVWIGNGLKVTCRWF